MDYTYFVTGRVVFFCWLDWHGLVCPQYLPQFPFEHQMLSVLFELSHQSSSNNIITP